MSREMIARVLLTLAGIVVLAIALGPWRWRIKTRALMETLGAAGRGGLPSYAEREIESLPPPVQRYFRAVLREGQVIVRRARIEWRGEFNMGRPGEDKWRPFTATQVFVPRAPGFVWDARIAMAPGMPVFVRDAFVSGIGSMHGSIFGLWPVVSSEGSPAIAAAALQRYLAEAVWFPTALLPRQGVEWKALDDGRAQATIRSGAVGASVEFRFGAEGLVESMYVPDRLFDNGKDPATPERWQGRILRYREHEGTRVPAESVVEWLLDSGTFAYWRGRPLNIEYE